MTVKIDPAKINAYKKALGLTLKDIELESCGSITEDQLKYTLNRSLSLRKSLLSILASILRCEIDDLVDDEYLRKMSIPVSVQLLTSRLYSEARNDFSPSYEEYVRDKGKSPGFRALMSQASQLFMILTEKDDSPDGLPNLTGARDFIRDQFSEVTQAVIFEGVDATTMSWFLKNLSNIPEDEVFALSLYVFTYALLLFESLMHHELVSSAIYLSPHRQGNAVNQYAALAIPLEKARQNLLDAVLNNGGLPAFEQLKEYTFEDVLTEKTLLLVSASMEVVNHVRSPKMASEYLNRKEVNGIVHELLTTLGEMDIIFDYNVATDIASSRFGLRYLAYRNSKKFLDSLLPGMVDNHLSTMQEDFYSKVADTMAQQQQQGMMQMVMAQMMFGGK